VGDRRTERGQSDDLDSRKPDDRSPGATKACRDMVHLLDATQATRLRRPSTRFPHFKWTLSRSARDSGSGRGADRALAERGRAGHAASASCCAETGLALAAHRGAAARHPTSATHAARSAAGAHDHAG